MTINSAMANGFNPTTKRIQRPGENSSKLGSRRIFAPVFKLQVLDSYRNDADCKGNQRATARKYGIHRRQIQKWLQVEDVLRGVAKGKRPASPAQPLDCSTPKRSAVASPRVEPLPTCAPVDLSLRKPLSPAHPGAWDLSWKAPITYDMPWSGPKLGYEAGPPPQVPAPAAAPVSKPFRLFRPFLDDNFEEVELPCPAPVQPCEASYPVGLPSPCGSAFEQVVPGLSPLSPYSYECDMSPLCCGSRPHTYSMDFKLETIRTCYYPEDCRGSVRSVCSKYRSPLQEDEGRRRADMLLVIT